MQIILSRLQDIKIDNSTNYKLQNNINNISNGMKFFFL